jgi:nicotinamidase-related amidase
VPVLFTRLVAHPRRGDDGVAPQARVTGFWTAGDSGEAAFLSGLTPAVGEDVIDKTVVSAFGAPETDAVLGRQGARYLILAGVSANGAVEHTARDAGDRGYGVVVVSDACAADTWELHTHVMTTLAGGLIRVRTTAAVLEMLDGERT